MPEKVYRPAKECFKISEKIRAQHLLWEDFKNERTDIPKMALYLWFNENELKAKWGTDEKGYLGLGLEYIPRLVPGIN